MKEKKKKRMRLKKKVVFIIIVLLTLIAFFSFSFINSKIQTTKLQNKITNVNNIFLKRDKVYKIRTEKGYLNSKNKRLDKYITNYLNDLLKEYEKIEKVINSKEYIDMFLISNINKEKLLEKEENLSIYSEELSKRRVVLNELLENGKINSYCNSEDLDDYKKIIKKLDYKVIKKYIKDIRDLDNDIKKEIDVLKYLDEYKDSWEVVEEFVEFKKRAIYEEFDKLDKSKRLGNFSFRLIADSVGPDIQAEDYVIYLNNSISISEKVRCIDEVDGDVECKIEGSYDKNNVGSYPIKITAVDKSNNYSEKTIQIIVKKRISDKPYLIDVIRNHNVVVVYKQDSNGEYTNIVKVFVCSTGRNNATPVGTYTTTRGAYWGGLYGNVWGQYTVRIVRDILFHSVPYYSPNKGDLEWEEYNKLGTQASMGCVRLAVRDVKWIYNNCKNGTTVRIYDGDLPPGVSKPAAIKIDGNSPNRGWDPTDDDPNNPWNS